VIQFDAIRRILGAAKTPEQLLFEPLPDGHRCEWSKSDEMVRYSTDNGKTWRVIDRWSGPHPYGVEALSTKNG
jgi:hypothetical protein